MSARYKHVTRRVRVRPRMRSIRAGIHAEYRADLETLRGLLEEQCLISDRLRAEVQAERRIGLKHHLRNWWRSGPCPTRWRVFLSRS